jgi:photosystem II stability/assembly factor-like uncharacterized protein
MKLSLLLVKLAICLVLALCLQVQDLSAQPSWQHTEICEDCVPETSYFRDSLFGYVHVSQASDLFGDHRHFVTTDGGRTWLELDSLSKYKNNKQIYHDISINSDGDIYISYDGGIPRVIAIYDLGQSIRVLDPWLLAYELKMTDSLDGRMVGRSAQGGVNWAQTYNGGENWYSLNDDRIVEGYRLSDARLTKSGAIASYKLDDTVIFERTIDSGKTWSSDTIQLPEAKHLAGPLSLGFETDRYFQVTPGIALDYIATADGGNTWTQHNVADGRMQRIYEPSANNLWAIVARTIGAMLPYIPHNIEIDPKYMADTLYFSTDAGATWEKDLTFANDTIADMHWPDAEHGFVVSYRDNKVKVSRLAGLMEVNKQIEVKRLEVWPNPSKDRVFTFTAPETGEYSLVVTDIAGRTVQSSEIFLSSSKVHKITLDSELPAGAYILSLNSEGASATAKLLLK